MTTKEKIKILLELLPQIECDEKGNATNLEYSCVGWNKWSSAWTPSFELNNVEYRIKPEPKTRPMTDKEAREFIIVNRDKIIIKHKDDGSLSNDWQYYLSCKNIANNFVYCFIEDFNCENPEQTLWKDFEVTE